MFSLTAAEPALLQQVRTAIQSAQPFRVDFVQEVFLEGEKELSESGTILYRDVSLLKWTYTDPEYKVFLLQGRRYRFYEKASNQLIIGRIQDKDQQWIWQILFSKEIDNAVRTVEAERTLFIRDTDGGLDLEVTLGGDGLPQRVVQRDEMGATTVYVFTHYRRRVNIERGAFELDLPADVEVVDNDAI